MSGLLNEWKFRQFRHMKTEAVTRFHRSVRALAAEYPPEEKRHPSGLVFSDSHLIEVLEIGLKCGHVLTITHDEISKPPESDFLPCPACGPRTR